MARVLDFCGIRVRETTTPALIHCLERRIGAGRAPLAIGFANHNFIVSCRALASEADSGRHILVVNDGIGLQAAAILRHGRGFRENMNGTDFVPRFLRESTRDLRVYLVGGTPGVVASAGAVIAAMPGCTLVGACDGYSLWTRQDEVIGEINAARANVLLVGLGNPRQERWILQHRDALGVDLVFAVGALFEWMTGTRRRAPALVRRLRLEWLYRLVLEPRRLFKRYTVDVARFFWLVLVRHR